MWEGRGKGGMEIGCGAQATKRAVHRQRPAAAARGGTYRRVAVDVEEGARASKDSAVCMSLWDPNGRNQRAPANYSKVAVTHHGRRPGGAHCEECHRCIRKRRHVRGRVRTPCFPSTPSTPPPLPGKCFARYFGNGVGDLVSFVLPEPLSPPPPLVIAFARLDSLFRFGPLNPLAAGSARSRFPCYAAVFPAPLPSPILRTPLVPAHARNRFLHCRTPQPDPTCMVSRSFDPNRPPRIT